MLQSSSYGAIAEAYARHWGPSSATMMLPVLQAQLLPLLPTDASILDLCCGTGDVAARLDALGYHVTGVDGTAELVEVPGGHFEVIDEATEAWRHVVEILDGIA